MTPQEKVYENKLRRAAQRQGLALVRSRVRDPRGLGHGTYKIVAADPGVLVCGGSAPGGFGLSLADVERVLLHGPRLDPGPREEAMADS